MPNNDGASAKDSWDDLHIPPELRNGEALKKFLEENPLTPEEQIEMERALERMRIKLHYKLKAEKKNPPKT